jgi:hypothetical protein
MGRGACIPFIGMVDALLRNAGCKRDNHPCRAGILRRQYIYYAWRFRVTVDVGDAEVRLISVCGIRDVVGSPNIGDGLPNLGSNGAHWFSWVRPAEASVYLAIGLNERDGGTLYNTLLFFAPDGSLLGKHRKLMPTGAGLVVFDTPFGRLGRLMCWENYMPLTRAALYALGSISTSPYLG